MIVVCPHCLTKNRVPEEKLKDNPKCGECKKELLPSYPIELTDETAPPYIDGNDLPVVVDYWAAWCGPCQMMAPQFKAAAEQAKSQGIYTRFAKINTEEAPRASAKANIRSIPTMVIYKHGKELARQSGLMNASQILQWVKQYS